MPQARSCIPIGFHLSELLSSACSTSVTVSINVQASCIALKQFSNDWKQDSNVITGNHPQSRNKQSLVQEALICLVAAQAPDARGDKDCWLFATAAADGRVLFWDMRMTPLRFKARKWDLFILFAVLDVNMTPRMCISESLTACIRPPMMHEMKNK